MKSVEKHLDNRYEWHLSAAQTAYYPEDYSESIRLAEWYRDGLNTWKRIQELPNVWKVRRVQIVSDDAISEGMGVCSLNFDRNGSVYFRVVLV